MTSDKPPYTTLCSPIAAANSDRVYLAETIFYTETSSCGPDTLVTEPVMNTPPVAANTDSKYYSS